MTYPRFFRVVRTSLLVLLTISLQSIAQAQGAKKPLPETPIRDADADHEEERSEWFLHGRVLPGKSSAELRHRAYQTKMQARAVRLARAHAAAQPASDAPLSSGGWTPLGPVPLASDATGTGFQDYHQVSGRATAVAIDPADPTGNTVYIGGAQGGVWKSTNAATSIANNVTWTALTDDQATLSIGSIVIQPGNSNPNQSVILVGTGEADPPPPLFGLLFPPPPPTPPPPSFLLLWGWRCLARSVGNQRAWERRQELCVGRFDTGIVVLALLYVVGGGGSNGGSGGGGQQQGTQPGTYTIVVTGTSGTLSHQSASTATLIVNQ